MLLGTPLAQVVIKLVSNNILKLISYLRVNILHLE
jgi:hypothetical protein